MKIGLGSFAPHKIAIIITFIIFLMTLVPVDLYESTIKEKNFMFLDIASYNYIILSLFLFILGCYTSYRIFSFGKANSYKYNYKMSIVTFVNFAATFACVLFIYRVSGSYDLIYLLSNNLSSDAPALRLSINSIIRNGNIAFVTPLALSAIVYISYWQATTPNISGNAFRLNKFWYHVNIFLYLITCLLLFNKTPIITLFLSLVLVNILVNTRERSISLFKIVATISLIVFSVISAFLYFQSIRYADGFSPVASIIGYFPASMNRLSALINGHLLFPAPNTGIYSFEGFWFFPFLSGIFDFPSLLGRLGVDLPKDGFENWRQTFVALQESGLNKNYNWLSIYGFTYQDFGWFGVLWFYVYGCFSGYIWKMFKSGSIVGIIVYPFIIFSFQWWSTPIVFNRDSMFIYIFAFLTYALSKLRWKIDQ